MTRIVRGFHLYLIIAAVLSVATFASAADAKKRPNIVLVMTDDKYSAIEQMARLWRKEVSFLPKPGSTEWPGFRTIQADCTELTTLCYIEGVHTNRRGLDSP